ncbi:MAG TPA: hypothetical protein HA254_02415 [Candidatus Diapherotrites archaeon]|uniref:Uncharacterized protein n=1 Tax=Candidatus Iainarchaeum sp. TaxID=3101447 RepID=A0A7J4IVF3_9ARCH|nr:hypothetical protein [Candidatus Diapherotrites archaeon]
MKRLTLATFGAIRRQVLKGGLGVYFSMETITISKSEYESLKKKARFADDVLVQLESSFNDMKEGRVRKWSH